MNSFWKKKEDKQMTINTKFNVGDTAWVIYHNKIQEGVVKVIQIVVNDFTIHESYVITLLSREDYILPAFDADVVFHTKEELLASL